MGDYGLQLRETQKVRRIYRVLERQFRRYLDEASRAKGNTGEALLRIMELRVDNVVRRLGFARTIWSARQLVSHGKVMVNGKKVDRASFRLAVGDVVTVKEKIQKLVRENLESLPGHQVPGWLSFDPSTLTANIVSVPTSDQVPFDVNVNLIVEFYR